MKVKKKQLKALFKIQIINRINKFKMLKINIKICKNK